MYRCVRICLVRSSPGRWVQNPCPKHIPLKPALSVFIWRTRRDSNSRPLPSEGSALCLHLPCLAQLCAADLDSCNARLTPKQEAFALAYCRLMNASDAYREAYHAGNMNPKTINEAASRLLKNSKVSARIAELKAPAIAAAGLSVERTLREIARVAYADPRRLFRADGTLVPIVELDEDAAGMIAAIEVDEEGRHDSGCACGIKIKRSRRRSKPRPLQARGHTAVGKLEFPGGAGGGADE